MIQKLVLQSIINKYYLGVNESVKWKTQNNELTIDFMTPNTEIIGNVTCTDFQLQDSELAIFFESYHEYADPTDLIEL